ncbi:MAG: hypothetical protein R2729_27605 [Bryobacteraceae bacterium]
MFAAVYGVGAYFLFLGVYLYLAAFTLNLAPHSVSGSSSAPAVFAVIADIALVTLFGLQHSIMARPAFKKQWTRIVPPHLERSTYVLTASAMVMLIIAGWQPIDGVVWRLTGPFEMAAYAVAGIGFLGVPLCSFLTDHFHLFGLRQTYPVFRSSRHLRWASPSESVGVPRRSPPQRRLFGEGWRGN